MTSIQEILSSIVGQLKVLSITVAALEEVVKEQNKITDATWTSMRGRMEGEIQSVYDQLASQILALSEN